MNLAEALKMRYKTGESVEIGDLVLIERGRTPGVVYQIIDSKEKIIEWGLDEFGISISAAPFGLVFWPSSEVEDPVVFVGRKKS